MSTITIKRGATFSETITLTSAGVATPLTGLTMSAMVRDAEENLVATITPTATGVAGQAMIYVQDTSAWPEGLLRMDVMVMTAGGARTISETIGIEVQHSETYTTPPQAPYDPVTS